MTPIEAITAIDTAAQRLDPDSAPNIRAVEECLAQKRALAKTRSQLANLPSDVEQLTRRLEAANEQRRMVLAKHAEVEQAIAAAPDPATIRDGRERDKAIEHQRTLVQQQALLRDGRLLSAPGVVYPRLSDCEAEVERLTKKLNIAQAALDAALAVADELLHRPTPVPTRG